MTIDEMLEEIKPKSPKVLLSFSRGKDAWGCWCALRDKVEMVPFHYYCGCPHLSFIDDYLAYAEHKMGTKIYNFPAPNLMENIGATKPACQPPNRGYIIEMYDWKAYTFEQMQDGIAKIAGLDPKTTYTALGVRACDRARRKLFFKTHGPISHNKRKFYPIYDWNKEKLISELKKHDVKLPIDYKMFGRTFDGTYYMYIAGIKKYYPEDYRRLKEYYPLIDCMEYKYEKRKAMGF